MKRLPEVSALSAVSEQAALEHVLRHHAGADGWIALSRREGERYKQYHYRVDDIARVLSEWMGEDAYFSQNTFYRPSRKIEYIRQLRALYVDVDNYLLNLDPEWTIASMELSLFGDRIPEPNLIIHSGRGLAIVWFIDPVPAKALPLWQAVENHFVRQLARFGGDAKASDAARVLRLAGTVNSKSEAPVMAQYRHDERYVLRELEREYLPMLRPGRRRKGEADTEPKMHNRMFRIYSLHYTRLKDLVTLCELREWDVIGHREVILFLYRYWSCCYIADPVEALENTKDINMHFKAPLSDSEVVTATRSAEKAWKARSNKEANRLAQERGYPGAGYNVTNEKLIEWLDITEEEQTRLETIIGRREKYDRKNAARQKARRATGMVTRDEYSAKTEERRREAIRLRDEGLSYRAIARTLGCAVSEAHRFINGRT